MKTSVLGTGSWGTALAKIAHQNKNEMVLWGRNPTHIAEIKRTGRNERFLPGIDLPRDWRLSSDFDEAVEGADCVLLAVPSHAFRSIAQRLAGYRGILVTVTKGIEHDTGLTMGGILEELAPESRVVALSGPTLALEVARDMPSAIVSASNSLDAARQVQTIFHRPTFRVYTSDDLLGVELGGALKNVVAIAAGIGDGLKFGDNSKAALVTRGIAEIGRLGVALGARAETFSGLSGLGDLMVTCFSTLSRNRTFGQRLGEGESAEEILTSGTVTVEGYPTAKSAAALASRVNVSTPIINEVHAMLHQAKNVRQSVQDLITRDSKPELQ